MSESVVVVVGSLNCDIAVRVDTLPLPNQTVLGHGTSLTAGGKGLNQAAAAAAAGSQAYLVGALGDDHFGEVIRAYLGRTPVDGGFIETVKDGTSGVAVITIDDVGNNVISVAPGANHQLTPGRAVMAVRSISDAAILLAQLETPIETVAAALRVARERGITTVLNPAPADLAILPHLPLVDILTPNESELAELTGTDLADIEQGGTGFDEAIAQLQARSQGVVIATRGGRGLVAYDGQDYIRIAAFPKKVVDSTGAGDVFNGALASCLARGETLRSAMIFGSAAAAISVTRRSAQGSAPTRADVEALLALAREAEAAVEGTA